MDKIKSSIRSMTKMDVRDLTEFQGNLKDLSKESYTQLKKLILKHGYSFVTHVWQNEGKNFILDGHQRTRTLTKMRQEGFEVPAIEVVLVSADNFKQAKEKVLAGTSQFGEMTGQGLCEFIAEGELDWREVITDFRFAEIDPVKWVEEFFGDPANGPGGDAYTKKIETPIYEPIEKVCPPASELFDITKTKKLIAEIKASDIPDDVKRFLLEATNRHTVFNYKKIAEFYAHSDEKIQDLMEKSALVIIDFNKAIENGFVVLTKEIADGYLNEE